MHGASTLRLRPPSPPASMDEIGSGAGTLSPIERSVVLLSRKDGLSSLPDRHPWRARVRRHLWLKTSNQIANPRLEALRRHAVVLRVRHNVSNDDARLFGEAGYGAGHVALVEQMVAPWRLECSRSAHIFPWALALFISASAYRFVTDAIGESMIGLVTAGLTIVSLAPLLAQSRSR
jgi:hypothetical protein